jgi:hypothetical protein
LRWDNGHKPEIFRILPSISLGRENAADTVGVQRVRHRNLHRHDQRQHGNLVAAQHSAEQLALLQNLRELKDREALASLAEDIKAEIERRKAAEAIDRALKDTAKKTITTKNKEFSDQLVTSALRGRFAREIEKMNLTGMPVEPKKMKDQNAVSYFQVCLVEKPNEPVGEIFSEGEHRCVALAAFLAELVWLELLKQIAPAVTRAAVIRDPNVSAGIGQWAVIQAMAPSMRVELSLVNIRDAGAIELDITAFARLSNGGLIVTATPFGYSTSRADHQTGGRS